MNREHLWRGLFVLVVLSNFEAPAARGQENGKEAYSTYCGGCHGQGGKGDEPWLGRSR